MEKFDRLLKTAYEELPSNPFDAEIYVDWAEKYAGTRAQLEMVNEVRKVIHDKVRKDWEDKWKDFK